MTAKGILIRLGFAVGALAVLILVVSFWPRGAVRTSSTSDVWTCSMHPQIRLPNPGSCPLCGMQLIPISKLPNARDDLETRAGLEVEPIQRRELFKDIRTVGKLDYSERQVEFITSRVAGRVDRVFADFTGFDVKKGDHLVEIYSPMLNLAQGELLSALESHEREKKVQASPAGRDSTDSGLETTRTKLRLLGILDEQIAEIERTRKPTTYLTIYAPLGGTVIEKDVRVGQYVAAGHQLYKIANFDPIWLYLNIYEYDVGWIRFGQPVEVMLEAFPGETFSGSVTFIDPFVEDATRTIRVRVNLKNPDRLLKPQMFATATIHVALSPDGTPAPTGLEEKFVCPMHPEVMQDEPGKCSICEMPLEKVPERRSKPKSRESKGKLDVTEDKSSDGPAVATDKKEDHTAHAIEPAAATKGAKPESHKGHKGHTAKPAPTKTAGSGEGVLAIPVSAVLETGRRRITYRRTGDGAYELVELKLGPRAHSMDESGKRREFFVVLDGVNEGDHVVSQSGFLLDSQRQIEGMPSLLYPTGQTGTSRHSGHGGMSGASPSMKDRPSGHEM